MREKLLFLAIGLTLPTAAMAGTPPIPGPEAGVGIGAMAALAIGYAVLKRRRHR